METLLKDLRFALRGLLKSRGFTAAAVLALALGIGATTAIFSVVHAVLLRSLGVGEESRVVGINAEQRGFGWKNGPISAPEVTDIRGLPQFEAVGAYSRRTASLQGERAERVETGLVTPGFFEALHVSPMYGRTFATGEEMKGADGVAIISASAWRRRFGGDPATVGRSVTINGVPRQIIGILPEGFSYSGDRDFW